MALSPQKLHWLMLNARQRALRAMGLKSYDEYLASPHWVALRKRVLAERNACAACACGGHLQLHHLNYDRLGKEQPEDVEVLCRACHEKAHDRKFGAAAKSALPLTDVNDFMKAELARRAK